MRPPTRVKEILRRLKPAGDLDHALAEISLDELFWSDWDIARCDAVQLVAVDGDGFAARVPQHSIGGVASDSILFLCYKLLIDVAL